MAVAVQSMGMRSAPTATAQEWLKALDRALRSGVEILTDAESGESFVASASTPGILWRVNRDRCSCPAFARFGRPCRHLAKYLWQLGQFPVPIPEPAPIVDCGDCAGEGVFYDKELEQRGLMYPSCSACRGTGIVGDAMRAGRS